MLLPITKYKEEIINAVNNHSFTIISAETGSGKSTQIPQYLADFYCQVIVTEPRIMAAKSLAKRVSEEMCVTLGQEVGYRTSYEKCSSPNSKILYCTDGLQLIKTIFSENTNTENVLIIDEVHEWNLNIETLVAWCKFMYKKWNTKVVIMSATLDTGELANFFGDDSTVLNIPGTLYNVKVEERPSYKFLNTIKENIIYGKNILIFVSGKTEINNVIQKLNDEDATILPLHGEMDWEEQKKCFEHYSNPKVIVATNVAQTSLTIPDIDVVIDTGEAKISIAQDGIQGLFLKDISLSDIAQRKGRAGRTKAGKYFLCSNKPMKYRDKYSIPGIQRSILDRVVLQLAVAGLDAEELQFFHQPDPQAILTAKKELNIIGALSGNQVTELGIKIVKLPVAVQLARMIVEAEKYGVTDQVLTIAAIIEIGGLLTPESRYKDFTNEKRSDLLAELDVWEYINNLHYIDFKRLGIKKRNFFKIKEHIKKLKEALYGIVEIKHNNNRNAVLKSCLYGLVSNIYIRDFDKYINENGTEAQLDKYSCLHSNAQIIIGIPHKVEFIAHYGWKRTINVVKFASKIDAKTLFELVPNSIKEETSLHYSINMDSVQIITNKVFAGVVVDTQISYDKTHPKYIELKKNYEKSMT